MLTYTSYASSCSRFIYRSGPVSTPYCFPSLLARVNQMSLFVEDQYGAVYTEEKAVYMNTIHARPFNGNHGQININKYIVW